MPEKPESPKDFTALYQSTLGPLRRYLARMLGNPTEAQDVAHDAYLRVKPELDQQRAHHPEALLYTTARRLALNQIKRRRISPISGGPAWVDDAATTAPGVVQQVMARQELHHLEQAIAQLPSGCRAVLLLRKLELLSHQEIAARLGISISTVEKQHARALRLLRTALSAASASRAPSTVPTPRPEAVS